MPARSRTMRRAINEKVRLYAQIGVALIAAREAKRDAYEAIAAVIPWERFRATVAEAEELARPEEFDAYQALGEHYAGIRRWAPAFLDAFEFQGVPAAAPLMRAIDILREMNKAAASRLPKSAPTGFVRERWARHVMPGGAIDRRYYELCVLSELRDRLRAGDVWVMGSRRYRSFEERLISHETLRELQANGAWPVAVDADFERFLAERKALLDKRLAAIELKAKGGLLPDVTLDKGVLKIAPIEKSTPPEAEALTARLYAMLPRVRITDLLSEVARWTMFPDCFTHLRTGEIAADQPRPDGRPARRRAQSRPDAHGRSMHGRQPRPARLDRRLAHPRRDLCPGAAPPGQPAAARAPRGAVRQRHGIVLGRPILPRRRLRPRRGAAQRALRRRAGQSSSTPTSPTATPRSTPR